MEIRCIALDLDRTTLDGDGYLPEENRKALEEVMEKGVQVVVASGRALSTLRQSGRWKGYGMPLHQTEPQYMNSTQENA